MAATKRNINDYKNRMSSPIGAVRIDKNGNPITTKSKSTKSAKKKK